MTDSQNPKELKKDASALFDNLYKENEEPSKESEIANSRQTPYLEQFLKCMVSDMENTVKFKAFFSPNVFDLIKTWLAFVALIILFTGWGCLKLSDNVLITLLSTTTIEILGLLAIILRHLFPNKK